MTDKTYILVLWCSLALSVSQGLDGTEFVLGFLENHITDHYPKARIYISTSNKQPTEVTISVPRMRKSNAWWIQQDYSDVKVNVTAEQGYIHEFSYDIHMLGNGIDDKGISVKSSDNITVHAQSVGPTSSDGYLVLPVSTLGTHYITVSHIFDNTPQQDEGSPSEIGIIAATTFTMVVIELLNENIHVKYSGFGAIKEGRRIELILDKYQIYQLQSSDDLSGTMITSSHPIVVLSGAKWTSRSKEHPGDHFIEMLPAVKHWGTEYFTTPLGATSSGDILKVVALSDDTHIEVTTLTQVPWIGNIALNSREYNHFIIQAGSNVFVKSSKPIMLVQFAQLQQSQIVIGSFNSMMIVVPSFKQWSDHYNVATFIPYYKNETYVNLLSVIVASSAIPHMQMNNRSAIDFEYVTKWTTIPRTSYSFASLQIFEETFEISNYYGETFYAVAYGSHDELSYGFPLGLFKAPQKYFPPTTTKLLTKSTTTLPTKSSSLFMSVFFTKVAKVDLPYAQTNNSSEVVTSLYQHMITTPAVAIVNKNGINSTTNTYIDITKAFDTQTATPRYQTKGKPENNSFENVSPSTMFNDFSSNSSILLNNIISTTELGVTMSTDKQREINIETTLMFKSTVSTSINTSVPSQNQFGVTIESHTNKDKNNFTSAFSLSTEHFPITSTTTNAGNSNEFQNTRNTQTAAKVTEYPAVTYTTTNGNPDSITINKGHGQTTEDISSIWSTILTLSSANGDDPIGTTILSDGSGSGHIEDLEEIVTSTSISTENLSDVDSIFTIASIAEGNPSTPTDEVVSYSSVQGSGESIEPDTSTIFSSGDEDLIVDIGKSKLPKLDSSTAATSRNTYSPTIIANKVSEMNSQSTTDSAAELSGIETTVHLDECTLKEQSTADDQTIVYQDETTFKTQSIADHKTPVSSTYKKVTQLNTIISTDILSHTESMRLESDATTLQIESSTSVITEKTQIYTPAEDIETSTADVITSKSLINDDTTLDYYTHSPTIVADSANITTESIFLDQSTIQRNVISESKSSTDSMNIEDFASVSLSSSSHQSIPTSVATMLNVSQYLAIITSDDSLVTVKTTHNNDSKYISAKTEGNEKAIRKYLSVILLFTVPVGIIVLCCVCFMCGSICGLCKGLRKKACCKRFNAARIIDVVPYRNNSSILDYKDKSCYTDPMVLKHYYSETYKAIYGEASLHDVTMYSYKLDSENFLRKKDIIDSKLLKSNKENLSLNSRNIFLASDVINSSTPSHYTDGTKSISKICVRVLKKQKRKKVKRKNRDYNNEDYIIRDLCSSNNGTTEYNYNLDISNSDGFTTSYPNSRVSSAKRLISKSSSTVHPAGNHFSNKVIRKPCYEKANSKSIAKVYTSSKRKSSAKSSHSFLSSPTVYPLDSSSADSAKDLISSSSSSTSSATNNPSLQNIHIPSYLHFENEIAPKAKDLTLLHSIDSDHNRSIHIPEPINFISELQEIQESHRNSVISMAASKLLQSSSSSIQPLEPTTNATQTQHSNVTKTPYSSVNKRLQKARRYYSGI